MPRPRPLYFAYGSNLSVTQMIARCQYNPSVSAKPLAVAHLPDWTWIINQRGYANVVPPSLELDSSLSEATTTDDVLPSTGVYGLLYAMDREDEQSLDVYEGVDVGRRSNKDSESGQPSHVRPTEQGSGAYNKWYIDVRVVKALDVTVEVDEIERVLVYVDELRIKESGPRDEYVDRMNRGIQEAMTLGLPASWVERVVRPFIPAAADEKTRKSELR
ncbi:hypothetical protein BDZ89DRAFT_1055740 [Hymenopellis radicata]|nr:hypothetical protein BDZ89DRAFT_1055740 [Hymenopellis radicata]